MNATAQDKAAGSRVADVVNRAKSAGRGLAGDPEKRKAARSIVRDKVSKIKERRRWRPEDPGAQGRKRAREAGGNAYGRGGRPASTATGGTAQSSPAQADAERRMGPPDHAKAYGYRAKQEAGGEKPAPGGPTSGPMAEQASKREDFKAAMLERRASREREKGEPPEDRGQGQERGR